MCIKSNRHITILGGGPAGLAIGYYAKKSQLPFTIYEANKRVGGNCVTLQHDKFLYDSGAHRFHDKDPRVTEEIKQLLGEDLRKINSPSQIFHSGKYIDFPLSPLNLIRNIGADKTLRAGFDFVSSKLRSHKNGSFENYALGAYGKTIANDFLLNYSRKLWGISCKNLSPAVAGKRLEGLNLKTFLLEAISGQKVKTEHLDGSFYYPKMGYGTIVDKLADYCGEGNIKKNAGVTKVFHDHDKIKGVEINGKTQIATEELVSTLPVTLFLRMMDPKPPQKILDLVNSIQFRSLILVGLFLDKETVTPNATVYFPESKYAFTRIIEPRNRSVHMSPQGKTSLIAEIPCQNEDEVWNLKDGELIERITNQLCGIKWIKEREILGSTVYRVHYAYPVLEKGFEQKIEPIMGYLKRFKNLKISGRSGIFKYTHMHDMIGFGHTIIEEYLANYEEKAAAMVSPG
ncbi:MAG: FAD-dependent oxidoreductase [Flavobacteriales bacterium]|nr:FAD-dependent oxidoreductase [Flavobacteriales bacterium]